MEKCVLYAANRVKMKCERQFVKIIDKSFALDRRATIFITV